MSLLSWPGRGKRPSRARRRKGAVPDLEEPFTGSQARAAGSVSRFLGGSPVEGEAKYEASESATSRDLQVGLNSCSCSGAGQPGAGRLTSLTSVSTSVKCR